MKSFVLFLTFLVGLFVLTGLATYLYNRGGITVMYESESPESESEFGPGTTISLNRPDYHERRIGLPVYAKQVVTNSSTIQFGNIEEFLLGNLFINILWLGAISFLATWMIERRETERKTGRALRQ